MRGYLLVLLAASLWATTGVFYKILIENHGLSPLATAALRAGVGGLLLLGTLLAARVDLRVPRDRLPGFIAYGVFGVAVFFVCYVNAVARIGVALSAVLMYTSPAWVALAARLFLGEKVGRRRLIALLWASIGAALVARVYDSAGVTLNWPGLVLGIASGIAYASYSIANKILVRRDRPWVVQVYGLLIGAVVLATLVPPAELARGWATPATLLLVLGLGIIPTLLAGLAFAVGVQWVPVSVAAIVATWEPAMAMVFGCALFGEQLELLQWVGALCILAAVVLLRPDAKA